jgi:hypothetical protein
LSKLSKKIYMASGPNRIVSAELRFGAGWLTGRGKTIVQLNSES